MLLTYNYIFHPGPPTPPPESPRRKYEIIKKTIIQHIYSTFNNDKNFKTWFESFKAELENAIKK